MGMLGGSATELDLSAAYAGHSLPSAVVFDPTHGRMIWADLVFGSLGTSKLDFSDPRPFNVGDADRGLVRALALDLPDERVYWVDSSNTIQWASLNETGEHGVLDTGAGPKKFIEGIAIDQETRTVYWSNWPFDDDLVAVDPNYPMIGFASLDSGGASGTLDTYGQITGGGMLGLSIDPTRHRLLWAEGESIEYANLDGSGAGELVDTGGAGPRGTFYDAESDRVLWTQSNDALNPIGFADAADGAGAGALPAGGIDSTRAPNGTPALVKPSVAWIAPGRGRDFGAVTMPESASGTIAIRSTGFQPIDVESVTLDGPGAAQFTIAGDCVGTLSAGSECGLDVKFQTTQQPSTSSAQLKVVTSVGEFTRPLLGSSVLPKPPVVGSVSPDTRCHARKSRKSARMSFTMSSAGPATITLQRRISTRKSPRRCPSASLTVKRGARAGRTRTSRIDAVAGSNTVDVNKLFKIKPGTLAPGHYLVTIDAQSAYGEHSNLGAGWFWVLAR
jgi:hypothetical protein